MNSWCRDFDHFYNKLWKRAFFVKLYVFLGKFGTFSHVRLILDYYYKRRQIRIVEHIRRSMKDDISDAEEYLRHKVTIHVWTCNYCNIDIRLNTIWNKIYIRWFPLDFSVNIYIVCLQFDLLEDYQSPKPFPKDMFAEFDIPNQMTYILLGTSQTGKYFHRQTQPQLRYMKIIYLSIYLSATTNTVI